MSLSNLIKLIEQERKKVEQVIINNAQSLHFHDIVREIDFSPNEEKYENFKHGDQFDFRLCQGHFSTTINRQEAILTSSSYQLKIATFNGVEVEHYYDSLAAAVKKAQDTGVFDVPF